MIFFEPCRAGKGMRKASMHFKRLSIFRNLYDGPPLHIPCGPPSDASRPVTSPTVSLHKPSSFASRVQDTLSSVPAAEASGTIQSDAEVQALGRPGRVLLDFKGLRPKKEREGAGASPQGAGRTRLRVLRARDASKSPVATKGEMPAGIAVRTPLGTGDSRPGTHLDHGQIRRAAKHFAEAVGDTTSKA